jgi:hypothetical protein
MPGGLRQGRSVALLAVILLTIALVLRPIREREHPNDATLVVDSKRYWIWEHPKHTHLEFSVTITGPLTLLSVGISIVFMLESRSHHQ